MHIHVTPSPTPITILTHIPRSANRTAYETGIIRICIFKLLKWLKEPLYLEDCYKCQYCTDIVCLMSLVNVLSDILEFYIENMQHVADMKYVTERTRSK